MMTTQQLEAMEAGQTESFGAWKVTVGQLKNGKKAFFLYVRDVQNAFNCRTATGCVSQYNWQIAQDAKRGKANV